MAIGTLRNIGEVDHLASYRLASDRAGNIQLINENDAVNLGKNPGQLQLIAVIGEIIEPFAVRAGVLVPHLLQPRPGLAVDPDTQGGTPVITGTRVPYDAVAGLMRDGSRDCITSATPSARRVRLGLALAVGAIIASMPMIIRELEIASSQRLVLITAVDPRRRFDITDPRKTPPSPYWPH